MSFKRALAAVFVAAAALPAAAAAQTPITPPEGDNYLNPIFINDATAPLQYNNPIGFTADTTNYTTQADMFNPPGSGGPPEPTSCGSSTYGKTIWTVFYSSRYGVMSLDSAGPFDSVIAAIPFQDPNHPTPDLRNGLCTDSLAGFQESGQFLVGPKEWWAVQVGGTGSPGGGQLQLKLDFEPPPQINGDAVLSWNSASGGATVKSLVLSPPRGAKVKISCTNHGCGKPPRTFTARKVGAGPLMKPIGAVGPQAGLLPGVAMQPSAPIGQAAPARAPRVRAKPVRLDAVVHAAKKYSVLKGRKLKAGSRLEVRYSAPGYIGQYFAWTVKGNGVSTKTIRCMNPASSTPRKKCTG